jgi:hypothetical protein
MGALAGQHALEIVPEGKDHDADQQDQPDLLGDFSLPFAERLAQNALNQEKERE